MLDNELIAINKKYQGQMGQMQLEAAAQLTLCHCVREMNRTLLRIARVLEASQPKPEVESPPASP